MSSVPRRSPKRWNDRSIGKVDQGILIKVEMAFRAHDPCYACATHFALGEMPLVIRMYDRDKKLVKQISR